MLRTFARIAPALSILALLWSACQKIDLPPEQPASPLFGVSAELDGQALVLEAGVDDYYMFTEAAADSSGVFVYKGTFRKRSCATAACPNTLSFAFFDLAPSSQPDALQAVYPGVHPVATIPYRDTVVVLDTIEWYELHLDATPSLVPAVSVPQYWWRLPDSVELFGQKASVILPSMDNGLVVTLQLQSSNDCSSKQSRYVGPPSPVGSTPCAVWIDTLKQPASPAPAFLEAVGIGVPPFQFVWSNGDTMAVRPLTNTTPQSAIGVTLTDAAGCKAQASIYSPSLLQGQFCSARFDWQLETHTSLDSQLTFVNLPYHPGAAIIAFIDQNGQYFSTLLGPQDPDDAVEILSVKPFEPNEQGQPTLQLQIRFSCTLWSANGLPIQLRNGTGTIAIARKG